MSKLWKLCVGSVLLLFAAALPTYGEGPAGAVGDVPEGSAPAVVKVAAGEAHVCALLVGGVVKCWGYNLEGQLGVGDHKNRGDDPGEMGDQLPAVRLGTGRTAVDVAVGDDFSCALLDDGTVKCWGRPPGDEDPAGLGDDPYEMGDALPVLDLGPGRTAVAISAGPTHVCARLDNNTLKCWGSNGTGELGIGDELPRGDTPGTMGDGLPVVDVGTGRTAAAVDAGGTHTCAILDDLALKCWGRNNRGQLGLGNTTDRGDGPNEMGDNLAAVDLGTGRFPTMVSASGGSGENTCAVLDNGTVKCWGSDSEGRLGLGPPFADLGVYPGQMGDELAEVPLGAGRSAAEVSAGARHTCVLLDDGGVKCWGDNGFGELGVGDTSDRGAGAGDMGDNLPEVALGTDRTATQVDTGGMAQGGAFTCVVLDDGTVKCWGDNHRGQLGQGDGITRGDGPGEMGDALAPIDLGRSTRYVLPDGFIRRAGGTFVGRHVINTTGRDQTVTVGRNRGGNVEVYLKVRNDGDDPARIAIQRISNDPGLSARYFLADSGTEVTSAIRAGTFRTGRLDPTGTTHLRVVVTVQPTARRDAAHHLIVRSSSVSPVVLTDTVRLTVEVH